MGTTKKMPLPSYYVDFRKKTTVITDAEQQTLVSWAKTEMGIWDARLPK